MQLFTPFVLATFLAGCGGGSKSSPASSLNSKETENNKPTVAIVGDSKALEKQTLILTGQANDTDGQVQSYKWSFDSGNLEVTGLNSRELSVKSGEISQDESVEFTLTVVDNDGAQSSVSHAVLFIDEPPLPEIPQSIFIDGASQHEEQTEFTLELVTTVPSTDITQISWQHDSELEIVLTDADTAKLKVTLPDIKTATLVNFSVQIIDLNNDVLSATLEVELLAEPNKVPSVVVQGTDKALEKTAFNLNANATDIDGEIISYAWQHDSDLELELVGSDSATLLVTSPDIQSEQEIEFIVTVSDDQGDQSSATQSVLLKPIKENLTIMGKVTDAPIPNALVQLNVGDETFRTTANEDGDYTLQFEVDESKAQELIKLRALGTGTQSYVELVSQLGTIAQLKSAAGEDLSLNADEYFDVNITNVTTAEDALIARNVEVISTYSALLEARQNVDPSELLTLASLLKSVIDYGVALPENIETTLQLAQNDSVSQAMIKSLQVTTPELIPQIEEEIKADSDLVNHEQFSPSGSYYLVESGYLNGLAIKLNFNEDNTGTLLSFDEIPFEWQLDGTEVLISLNSEFSSYSSHYQRLVDFKAKRLRLSVFDSSEHYHSVTASFDNTEFALGGPERVNMVAKLFKEKTKTLPQSQKFHGSWVLNYHDEYKNQHYVTMTLGDDNEATLDFLGADAQWSIVDNVLHISSDRYTLNIELVRNIGLGLQVVVNSISENSIEVSPALMVKTQDINFADIDYQRSWQLFQHKHANSQFIIDENDDYHFRWAKYKEGELKDGVLNRYNYRYNYSAIPWCDITIEHCEISSTDSYKLLAIHEDKIAVEVRQQFGDSEGSFTDNKFVHIFELSDETWVLGQFNRAFFEQDELVTRHDADTHLYAQTQEGVIHLRTFKQCPATSEHYSECKNIILLNQQQFYAELEGELIKLTDVNSNEVSYLEMVNETADDIIICHYLEGQVCNSNNQLAFTYSKPLLTIDFEISGQGVVEASTESFRYDELFFVDITAAQGSFIGDVTGCDGFFTEYQRTSGKYAVADQTEDCTIRVEFYSEEVISGDFLFVNEPGHELPSSNYFTIDDPHSGTLYGLQRIRPFNLTRTANKKYKARIKSWESVIVKLDESRLLEVRGFDLSIEEDGTYLSWYVYQDSEYKTLEKRKVTNSTDLQSVNVNANSLAGRWILTYGYNNIWSLYPSLDFDLWFPFWPPKPMTDQTYILELDVDNKGRLISGLDTESEMSIEFNWVLNEEGKLHLSTLNESDFAVLTLFDTRPGGFAFAIDSVSQLDIGGYNEHWLRHGSGILFQSLSNVSFEDVVGRYRTLNGSSSFHILENGTLVNNNGKYKKSVTLNDDTLIFSYVHNTTSDKADPHCDLESPDCELREYQKYQVLGIHEDRIYLNALSDNNEKSFVVFDFSKGLKPTDFVPDDLNGLLLYDEFNGSPRQWHFDTDEQENAVTLTISAKDGEVVYPIYLDNGVIVARGEEENMRLKILSSDSEGIIACWYSLNNACGLENTLNFSYTPPKINISLNITGDVRYKTSFEAGYILFGQLAGMSVYVGYSTDAKLTHFEGCGLRVFRENAGRTTLNTPMLFEDCSINMVIE
ncbi:carboxypeptidase-like regulatory domain-containing protein [Pseudoalteromonas umbrosa]|uniref:carboxypeptidase-like regulatory domain-containing protein n=1 Tax=Pseudoalteromonas umbrosa TaxID=3048489 RepID=UPI0024C39C8C|nr:hypothetical protein [Pseudoalteromonas sp. B95]MDK1285757.1 hypothetical protein [Pseudoalteromonas sp. B95]